MKKIAIIGNGTAGCISALGLFSHINANNLNVDIEWYFDSKIKALTVGEGSLLSLPHLLSRTLLFNSSDLLEVDGTIKLGIEKHNWGNSDKYIEAFNFGSNAMHFNATKLQEFIIKKLKLTNIKFIEKNIINYNDIDSDHVIDSTGFPKNFLDYKISDYIPVNTAYVTKCYWDYPRLNNTLTIARPYGWVFGIPLLNRIAIGYIFNRNINSLEEVKEDVKNVFDQFRLNPSNETTYLEFNNYYRETNFKKRLSFNGNASFFFEPLEATTLEIACVNTFLRNNFLFNGFSINDCNDKFKELIEETETIIMLHYFAGSKFKTPFWDYAQERGRKKMEQAVKLNKFRYFYKKSSIPITAKVDRQEEIFFGTWGDKIMNQNLYKLNLKSILDKMIND